jgi:hypothetical protein
MCPSRKLAPSECRMSSGGCWGSAFLRKCERPWQPRCGMKQLPLRATTGQRGDERRHVVSSMAAGTVSSDIFVVAAVNGDSMNGVEAHRWPSSSTSLPRQSMHPPVRLNGCCCSPVAAAGACTQCSQRRQEHADVHEDESRAQRRQEAQGSEGDPPGDDNEGGEAKLHCEPMERRTQTAA